MSQSSNDTFPTAMHIAAVEEFDAPPAARRHGLREALDGQGRASSPTSIKIGRTHLMDAVPLTLGQEFSGYVAQLDHDLRLGCALCCPTCTSWPSAGRRSAPA